MKTIKSLTEEDLAELPKLSENWKWIRLGEIHILKSDKHKGSGESLFYIGLEHIKKDQGTLTEDVKVDVINAVKNSFKKGDLLYGKLRPYLNKVYLANEDGVCSTDILVFKSTPLLNPNYSKYFFLSYKFVNDMTHNSSGVNLPRVSTKYLLEYPFPLAPLPEQRAIVSKIEQLFSELDNGIANLKLAQEQLKVYRQAVLKKAFEGELTKKWREQQKDLPDAGDLLEQIRKEREEVAKIGKKLQNNPLSEKELVELPNGWCWTKLGNLVEEPKYGTSKKCDYNIDGIGVLRIPNISDGLINDSDLKFAQFDSNSIENYRLKAGDILTIRSNGSVDLVGKCALVNTKDEKYLYAGYLIRLRPNSSLINSKYLLNCLSSIDLRYQIESKAKSTSGVNNINSGELQSLIIPICSSSEQQAIVQEIETRLSVCDKIEQDIETNLEKAEALRHSILKKAFEGKLLNEKELAEVRKAEDWEPADVLLERIRAEKTRK